jgi:hypothetical protein
LQILRFLFQINKIKFLLKAFNLLVPIIEEFRKERLVIDIDDEFKQQLKKRKLN